MIIGFSFTPPPSGYMIDFISRDVTTAINLVITAEVALKIHPVEYAPDNHKTADCPHMDQYKNVPTDTTHLNCINCKRANLKYDDHTATSPKCRTYVIAQNKLRGNIPYYKASKTCWATHYINFIIMCIMERPIHMQQA